MRRCARPSPPLNSPTPAASTTTDHDPSTSHPTTPHRPTIPDNRTAQDAIEVRVKQLSATLENERKLVSGECRQLRDRIQAAEDKATDQILEFEQVHHGESSAGLAPPTHPIFTTKTSHGTLVEIVEPERAAKPATGSSRICAPTKGASGPVQSVPGEEHWYVSEDRYQFTPSLRPPTPAL